MKNKPINKIDLQILYLKPEFNVIANNRVLNSLNNTALAIHFVQEARSEK